ncbi:MAG TPA: ribosome silencing factor [Ilumatobacteraceae bacterium]|nr:ribosome silencing factor [Ilumatobacteraceae bacterium]
MSDVSARQLACVAARAADEKKGVDVRVLYVGEVLNITEYFVIASASNRRLVKTLVDEVEAAVRAQIGRSPIRAEGVGEQQWVLIDFGDVVVHVFSEEMRAYYEIERLYRDVPSVDWAAVTATLPMPLDSAVDPDE